MNKSFTAYVLKMPTAVSMLFGLGVLLGLLVLPRMAVEMMPNTDFLHMTVMTPVKGGMAPVDVEGLVTLPIEEVLGRVDGLDHMSSMSEEGRSRITLVFEPGTNMDYALLEVREKMSKVKGTMPPEAEETTVSKFEHNDVPVMVVAFMSDTMRLEDIRKPVDTVLKKALLKVSGVANVEVAGGRDEKIFVDVNAIELSAVGLGLEGTRSQLSASNANMPVGHWDGKIVRTIGRWDSLEAIGNTVIFKDEEQFVRLGDVARVYKGYSEAREMAKVRGSSSVSVYIQKDSNANTVAVAKAIEGVLKVFEEGVGRDKAWEVSVVTNQAEFVNQAIWRVMTALLYGALLAVGVLFLGLGHAGALVSVFLSLPLSLLMTFPLMYWKGISFNVMSLSGLALGVGLLVDNAVMVVEHILKQREGSHEERICVGTSQITWPMMAATLTTVIVFLPLVFSNYDIRVRYGNLAFTVVMALGSSLIVALMLISCFGADHTVFRGGNRKVSKAVCARVDQKPAPQCFCFRGRVAYLYSSCGWKFYLS